MAGDVIFTEGSDAAATAVRQIETARLAQHQAADVEMAVVRKQQALTAGAAAGIVFLIVLLLIPVPRARVASREPPTPASRSTRVVDPSATHGREQPTRPGRLPRPRR